MILIRVNNLKLCKKKKNNKCLPQPQLCGKLNHITRMIRYTFLRLLLTLQTFGILNKGKLNIRNSVKPLIKKKKVGRKLTHVKLS